VIFVAAWETLRTEVKIENSLVTLRLLDKLGEKEWELVQAFPSPNNSDMEVLYFKRQKQMTVVSQPE
jgi:hypothetical protein